jgi:hypothetical protein
MIKNLIIHTSLYLMNGAYNLHTITITYFFRPLICYLYAELPEAIHIVQDE